MAGKTNGFEIALLQHIFQNADVANVGDATGLRGSTTAGSFYIALFTADPGEAGSVTNECAYTSYARVAVARNNTQWVTDGGNGLQNANAITFPTATGGSETASYFGICTASSGSNLIMYAALGANLAISTGITPEFAAGDLGVTED